MTAITSASPHHPSADVQGRRAEHERQRAISASFSKFIGHEGIDQLQRQCVDDINCTPALANQRILAHLARGAESAAAFYVPSDPGADGRLATFCAAASDAILIRTGIRVAEPHPATRDVQRMSLTAIAENVLRMRGMSVTGKGPAALIKAALGTSDFPALLSNTANKALLSGYDAAPQTHALWTGEREVRDFKLNTLVALGEAPGLEQVPELGEYKQGAMAEAAESFAIAKYGKIVALSREAMINDDLAAFTKLPRAFGAAARRLEADKVYGRLTGNPVTSDGNALFSVAHGNLSASGAAPSVESLGAARAAMRKQMGVGNLDYIDPAPKYLVVPVSLETKCEQLLASLVDPSKSNDTANVQWIRGLTLVADPRLDADSETAWYLSADPAQIEGIVRVYLAGEQRPALEEDSSFDTDALAWKTRLEFAAAVVGWRALFKNPGA